MTSIHHFLVRQIEVESTPGHSYHPLKDISSQDNMDTARQTKLPEAKPIRHTQVESTVVLL